MAYFSGVKALLTPVSKSIFPGYVSMASLRMATMSTVSSNLVPWGGGCLQHVDQLQEGNRRVRLYQGSSYTCCFCLHNLIKASVGSGHILSKLNGVGIISLHIMVLYMDLYPAPTYLLLLLNRCQYDFSPGIISDLNSKTFRQG